MAEIKPMVNQIEYHPLRTAENLKGYMAANGIVLQAYTPLCRLIDPLRHSDLLSALSAKYGKSAGQIVLRWHIQNGSMPVFKTYNPKRFAENIDVFGFCLTGEDMAAISALNRNYKYHLESSCCPGY